MSKPTQADLDTDRETAMWEPCIIPLIDKIENAQDDGSEGMPWTQDEIDLILDALRTYACLLEIHRTVHSWADVPVINERDQWTVMRVKELLLAYQAATKALESQYETITQFAKRGKEAESALTEKQSQLDSAMSALNKEMKRAENAERYWQEQRERAEKAEAERDKHYNRVASFLFSGALDKITGTQCREWEKEYLNYKAECDRLNNEIHALHAEHSEDALREALEYWVDVAQNDERYSAWLGKARAALAKASHD